MRSSTVAIVQPYEYVSVAEQRYVLGQYACNRGVAIDRFVGDDCLLNAGEPVLDTLLELIASGLIRQILLLQGISEKLPQGFCDRAKALGSEISFVEYHKSAVVFA